MQSGATVTLSGAGSGDTDGQIVQYVWEQTAGPSVALSGALTVQAQFTAPSVQAQTTLRFRITVTDDGGAQASDTVQVLVNPLPPAVTKGPRTIGGVGTGGTSQVAKVSGNRAYLLESTASLSVLNIFDVSDPTEPALLGSIANTWSYYPSDFAIVGDHIVTSAGEVIDVSDPAEPVIVGSTPEPIGIGRIVAANGYAYLSYASLGNSRRLLVTLDIRNPAAPVVVSSIAAPDPSYGSYGLALNGDRLYVSNGADLHLFDISNPAAPVPIGVQLEVVPGRGSNDISGLVAAGDRVYVTDSREGSLRILRPNLSNPQDPRLLIPVSELGFPSANYGSGLRLVGDLAYVGVGSGIEIVDVSNPSVPLRVGSLGVPNGTGGFDVVNGIAWFANGYLAGGLRVADVSNPAAPFVISYVEAHTPYGAPLAKIGNVIWLGGALGGVRAIDVTDPYSPSVVGDFDTVSFGGSGVAVLGLRAYVADGAIENDGEQNGGLRILDVSNPAAPVTLGTLGLPYASELAVHGNLAYVIGNGLSIVDVSNPAAPVVRGTTEEPVASIALSGNHAYGWDGNFGLKIIDVSNPDAPVTVGSYAIDVSGFGYPLGIAAAGSYVYLSDRQGQLIVVDVSNPAAPRRVGHVLTPMVRATFDPHFTPGGYMALSGNRVYVTNGAAGLRIIDVSNPANPVIVADPSTILEAHHIKVENDYAYVGTGGGLVILDLAAGP